MYWMVIVGGLLVMCVVYGSCLLCVVDLVVYLLVWVVLIVLL